MRAMLLAILFMLELAPHVGRWFPGADGVEPFSGEPPAAAVRSGAMLAGYVFLSDRISPIPAYSGKPLTVLVGIDTRGVIRGAVLLAHQEPILVTGVTDARLAAFIEQFAGLKALDKVQIGGSRTGYLTVDGISGATITASILNASIMNSARRVALSRGLTATPAAQAGPDTAKPLWRDAWRAKRWQIGALGLGLALLSAVLLFQDTLVRHPRLLGWLRTGFLLYTALFIGFYALAQLSVVNVLTFTQAVLHDFQWSTFLMDPLLFILWSFVAVVLLLWGRGVYCGWLCPYGALQELINEVGVCIGVRQRLFPPAVHERLWALKYIILLALVGVSMQSLTTAERYAEVEPFKTAITLRFQREWGYVLYAVALLAISAFNRKFFCKYLCPLGAALAIPARLRLFDWLKRHKECGHPCQICAVECEVQAIDSLGLINSNECHYCLDCQVTYFNDRKCPPMVGRRKRREQGRRAREVLAGAGIALEDTGGQRVIPIRSSGVAAPDPNPPPNK